MNHVRFVEPVRLELLAEVGYYHRVEAGLGTKFLESVKDATARAPAYTLACSLAQHRTRRVSKGFPIRTGLSLGRTGNHNLCTGLSCTQTRLLAESHG